MFISSLWSQVRRRFNKFCGLEYSGTAYLKLAQKYRWKLAWYHLRLKFNRVKLTSMDRGNFSSHGVDLFPGARIECIHKMDGSWFVTNLASGQVQPTSAGFNPMPHPDHQEEIVKDWAELNVEHQSRRWQFDWKTLTLRHPDPISPTVADAQETVKKISQTIILLKRLEVKEPTT